MWIDAARLRRRVSTLLPRRARPHVSVLMVPVPEAEVVQERWPAPLGAPGLPLHVTILYPFLDTSSIDGGIERELEALAARHPRFHYTLAGFGRFPGVLYLEPSPASGFVELTRAVHERWPDHPPYGGAYDDVVPHVTLTLGEEPAGLVDAIEPLLPLRAEAHELELLVAGGDGTWLPRARFPLAT